MSSAASGAASAYPVGVTQVSTAVLSLYEPPGGADAATLDIVFFHGLQVPYGYKDAWLKTWTSKVPGGGEVLWPQEWLGKHSFPSARVLSVHYNSNAVGGDLSFDRIGDMLCDELAFSCRVGGGGRPVVLVGHSLGGLALKKMCLAADERARDAMSTGGGDAARCAELCGAVRGAFFFATPHGGSKLADAAKKLFIVPQGPVMKYLQVLGDDLTKMNEDFYSVFARGRGIELEAVIETAPLQGVAMVVSNASASLYMGRRARPIQGEDHISIAKPTSMSASAYTFLCRFIEEVKDNPQGTARYSAVQPAATPVAQPPAGPVKTAAQWEEEHDTKVAPAIDFCTEQQKVLGERWAERVLLDSTPKELRDEARKHLRNAWLFWREVQRAYSPKRGEPPATLTDAFWTNRWAARGRNYRKCMEPLDIANWYANDKHFESGHYVKDIRESAAAEMETDNKNRPGRYIMIMKREAAVFPDQEMQSSLGSARRLKVEMEGKRWSEHKVEGGPLAPWEAPVQPPVAEQVLGPDVFISHAGPDKPLAEQLRYVLRNQLKLDVFLDKYMTPGTAADKAMLSAAHGAHVGLTLFSKEFSERDWPLRELGIFVEHSSLLPAIVPGVPAMPGLSYEDWKELLKNADVPEAVRSEALRTTMVIGEARELLTWQQKVCLAVVRRLVAKALRDDLPDRAWVGQFKVRVAGAAKQVLDSDYFEHLTRGDTCDLRKEAGALFAQLRS